MEVWNRCGDEGTQNPLPASSIEAAMNVSEIEGKDRRAEIFDQMKMISRTIITELMEERSKAMSQVGSKGDEG
jgi:hypothetical protein